MKKYMLITFIVVLTLFRIWLGVKTPLYLQADATCDDFLLVRYAANMLTGNWLGSFESLTLTKSAAFPAILAFGYLCGIPYSLGLIVSYVFAVALLCIALSQLIPDRRFTVFIVFSCDVSRRKYAETIQGRISHCFFSDYYCCDYWNVYQYCPKRNNFIEMESVWSSLVTHILVPKGGCCLDFAFCLRRSDLWGC